MTATQRAMSESKTWIELDRTSEVFNSRLDVLSSYSVIDIPSHSVATAEVLFVSLDVGGSMSRQVNSLVGAKLQVQSVNDALGDYVLHGDDVARIRVNSISPKNIPIRDIEKLCRDPNPRGRVQETCSKNSTHLQFATSLKRVLCESQGFLDGRRRAHDKRTKSHKFSNHGVGKRKLVEAN